MNTSTETSDLYANFTAHIWIHTVGEVCSISDFSDLDHLAQRIMSFVLEWNAQAHPFNWSSKFAAKGMARGGTQATLAAAA